MYLFALTPAHWSSTSITASLDLPSFVKVVILSTTPTLMSSAVKPSLVQKIPSAPSSPFQTIILPKRVDTSPSSLIPLIRKWCRGILILQGPLVVSGNIGERKRRRRRSLIGLRVARRISGRRGQAFVRRENLGRDDKKQTHISRAFYSISSMPFPYLSSVVVVLFR